MLLLLVASVFTNRLLDCPSKDHCIEDHKVEKVESISSRLHNKNNNGECWPGSIQPPSCFEHRLGNLPTATEAEGMPTLIG
jgi:hypothetical protein